MAKPGFEPKVSLIPKPMLFLLHHLAGCKCFRDGQGSGRCPPPEGTVGRGLRTLHPGIVEGVVCEAARSSRAGKPTLGSQQQPLPLRKRNGRPVAS